MERKNLLQVIHGAVLCEGMCVMCVVVVVCAVFVVNVRVLCVRCVRCDVFLVCFMR